MKTILCLCAGLCFVSYCGAQPSLDFSATLEGSGMTQALGVAVDTNGNMYVTGNTLATNLATPGVYQRNFTGNQDAFVAEVDTNGNMVFATYLGGGAAQSGLGIAVDTQGNIYVAGYTGSSDFPTKNALQPTNAGGYDAFVSELTPGGTGLVFSTYLGGKSFDAATAVGVDSNGETVVFGYTQSTNLEVANAFQPTNGGSGDAFVTKLAPGGASLVYSTYLGGNDSENNASTELNAFTTSLINSLGGGMAVGADGSAYVTGWTYSTNFPTTNAYQPTNMFGFSGAQGPYVAKFDTAGRLAYSTYFVGQYFDYSYGIGVDARGNAYFGGGVSGPDLPVTNAYQPSYAGSSGAIVSEGFLAALDATGTNLLYCTYFGGSGDEQINGIAVTPDGHVAVTGFTDSADFPMLNPIQSSGHSGLLTSVDGGADWAANPSGLTRAVTAIAVDPFNAATLYSITSSELYKSVDGGASWTQINNNFSTGSFYSSQGLLAFDPIHPGTFYYGAYSSLQKTTDGGASWTKITAGLPSPPYIQALAIDPRNPSTLYAGAYQGGVLKSVDGGTNWTPMNTGLNTMQIDSLLVDPRASSNVFVGVNNYFSAALFKSTNGGTNWTPINSLPSFEAPVVVMAANPGDNSIYVVIGDFVENAELYMTTNSGATWSIGMEILNGELKSLAVAPAPRPSLGILSGGGSNFIAWPSSFTGYALQASPSLSPANWQVVPMAPATNGSNLRVVVQAGPADAFYRLIYTNKIAPKPYVYLGADAASSLGMMQSVDGGATWEASGLDGDTVAAVAADPTNPNRVYAGLSAGYDTFISTFSPSGQLLFSTFLGGTGFDQGNAVALDANAVYMAGYTASPDYPGSPAVLPGPHLLDNEPPPAASSPERRRGHPGRGSSTRVRNPDSK